MGTIKSREVVRAAFARVKLDELVDKHGLEDTLDAFKELSTEIQSQFAQDYGDKEWRKRASLVLTKLNKRLVDLNSEVKRLRRERTASVEAADRRYGDLAYRLALVLRYLDPQILETITGPDEGITAAEWVTARELQRAQKGGLMGGEE